MGDAGERVRTGLLRSLTSDLDLHLGVVVAHNLVADSRAQVDHLRVCVVVEVVPLDCTAGGLIGYAC